MEFAGEVEAIGSDIEMPAVGTRVFGIVGGGAQAEYLTLHASHCATVPESLDLVAAGGIPEVFITAHDAMRTQAKVQTGERVLVHAAGSGVGTAVVQLAHALGCPVTGTARTADKLERARALGLDNAVVVASGTEPLALAEQISAFGAPDVIIDLVGGPYLTADVLAAAPGARIVMVGTLAGASAELPILGAMGKRLQLFGTVLRPRSVAEKAVATAAFTGEVVPLFATGTIEPIVEQVFPIDDATAAYELLASDATFGKVILRP
jgi:NADPH:quinone reductase-like Zn-dependent oxidoreductase